MHCSVAWCEPCCSLQAAWRLGSINTSDPPLGKKSRGVLFSLLGRFRTGILDGLVRSCVGHCNGLTLVRQLRGIRNQFLGNFSQRIFLPFSLQPLGEKVQRLECFTDRLSSRHDLARLPPRLVTYHSYLEVANTRTKCLLAHSLGAVSSSDRVPRDAYEAVVLLLSLD